MVDEQIHPIAIVLVVDNALRSRDAVTFETGLGVRATECPEQFVGIDHIEADTIFARSRYRLGTDAHR